MAPVPAPIGDTKVAGKVDMLVATTRQPSGSTATLFDGERGSKPHLTEITVSIPNGREQGSVQWPKKLPPDPRTDFAVTNVRQMETVAEGRAWFKQQANGSHALVFIHGFNNTYGDAVFRLAQIVHDSNMQATPVLFTWPSRAEITGYLYDKESTNYSRSGLEQALRTLAGDPSVKDITVLAHSMGSWLAMEALRQMGIRDGRVDPKIKNVILASPDIDIQVFAKQYVEMGEPRPRFTIFMSSDDKALAASSFITGRVSRLGAINPAEEPYRSRLEKAGITAIDLTKVETKDGLNHGKFAESPEIVQPDHGTNPDGFQCHARSGYHRSGRRNGDKYWCRCRKRRGRAGNDRRAALVSQDKTAARGNDTRRRPQASAARSVGMGWPLRLIKAMPANLDRQR